MRGVLLVYDHALHQLITPTGVYPTPFVRDGSIRLRIIEDRGSIELFTSDGLFNWGFNALLDPSRRNAELVYARGCRIEGNIYTLGL